MSIKILVTGLILLLAVGGLVYVLAGGDGGGNQHAGHDGEAAHCDEAAAADGLPTDGVVVYYFHGYKRCQTCNSMEALADLAIAERFAAQRSDGSVVFKAVNIETDTDRHFVDDFALSSKCVVMVTRRGGEDLGWRRLDEVWEKIGDETVYKDYIAENLDACLEEISGDAS